ncbi:MAG: hypothetical protein OEX00_05525 [Gammaproteobacteria bacterium]|nr:hypothetical protein [Gammaproteobacteria bacterium]MDH5691791.1 hypothetical protein [Gammaproteobacteria bacterium]
MAIRGKRIWISWLGGENPKIGPQELTLKLQQKGFQTYGSDWINDNAKLAWADLGNTLADQEEIDLWLICVDESSLQSTDIRFGLSLCATIIRESRGFQFPIYLLGLGFEPGQEDLPLLLKDVVCFTSNTPSWDAKILSSTYRKSKSEAPPYRVSVRANSSFGLWFELGPREGSWDGIMAGVDQMDGIKITHHAVGPKGVLPEKATMEYPIQGIVAEAGDDSFTLWAAKNHLGEDQSYYFKVEGQPSKLMFGAYPGSSQEMDMQVINLR